MKRLVVFLALVAMAPAARAADFFVDAAVGSDANDGLSWVAPKVTVSAALAAAAAMPGADGVYVAEGTYRERIVMPADVTLMGAFPSGGGPQDFNRHPTVLDAGGL